MSEYPIRSTSGYLSRREAMFSSRVFVKRKLDYLFRDCAKVLLQQRTLLIWAFEQGSCDWRGAEDIVQEGKTFQQDFRSFLVAAVSYQPERELTIALQTERGGNPEFHVELTLRQSGMVSELEMAYVRIPEGGFISRLLSGKRYDTTEADKRELTVRASNVKNILMDYINFGGPTEGIEGLMWCDYTASFPGIFHLVGEVPRTGELIDKDRPVGYVYDDMYSNHSQAQQRNALKLWSAPGYFIGLAGRDGQVMEPLDRAFLVADNQKLVERMQQIRRNKGALLADGSLV